ncbi:c-type cytochrome [Dongia soli]|uniref:Cytochrome c n=1 Tax=Dongia soli TaxID=600628 RepID=A0ABU5EDJ8_9PROT|nr:cytochrome c [Dongia soli]MDY0884425.1 cytochrome c [Dongia soli]
MRGALLLGFVLLALAGCDEMSHQPKYDSYERSKLFADGKSMQAPPAGSIGRDDPALLAALRQQPQMSRQLVERGRERFNIYCVPCHDQAGYGNGTVANRGFPHPPSFHIDRLRQASPAYFVDVITHGHGVMYAYAGRVAPADRWAIAAYIQALQLSQNAPVDNLSPAERERVEKADAAP